MSLPVLTLTERTTTPCRLPPADVDFLLARHGAHLKVLPTGRRHRYRLTPTHRVGVLDTPSQRIVILPKIPLRNVFFLLDADAALPEASAVDEGQGTEVLNFLAARLAAQMAGRCAAGLPRGYAERDTRGAYLQGRLDVPAQLREARAALHCRHDDFTVDVPANRLTKAVAGQLLRVPGLGEPVRTALQRALAGFAGVEDVPLSPAVVARAEASPAGGQDDLLPTCRILAEGLLTDSTPCFLLDLERLFERFVTRGVQEALAGVGGVVARPQASYPLGQGEGLDLEIRPDVTVERAGQAVLVLDVKWKRLGRGRPVTEDVYQVLAYLTALGARHGVLVYPGQREGGWSMAVGGVRLSVRALDLSGPPEKCRRGLRRLGRWLRGVV